MATRTPKRTRASRAPAAALLLLGAGLAAALLGGCGASPAGKDGADRAAEAALLAADDVAAVARADLATGVPVQGTLQPSVDVHLVAPFPEVLDAVLVKEGQAVHRGQVLARFRIASLAPAAAGAEAQRRIAAADYERMRNLFAEGAVSRRDVDGAEAQLTAAETVAALAAKQLDEATVTAPSAGVIAQRLVQSGDRPADGDPLFRLVNIDELEFSAGVPTEALGGVRPGAAVTLTVSGLEGVTAAGRVARVNATVDPATRQVRVYVIVPNRDHRLAGDMFASGRIVLREAKSALALPAGGARLAPDGAAYAWVVAGGRIQKRAVSLGLRDELRDLVEVRDGLREGEIVVVSPMEDLAPGQAVRVGDEGAAAASAGDRRTGDGRAGDSSAGGKRAPPEGK